MSLLAYHEGMVLDPGLCRWPWRRWTGDRSGRAMSVRLYSTPSLPLAVDCFCLLFRGVSWALKDDIEDPFRDRHFIVFALWPIVNHWINHCPLQNESSLRAALIYGRKQSLVGSFIPCPFRGWRNGSAIKGTDCSFRWHCWSPSTHMKVNCL